MNKYYKVWYRLTKGDNSVPAIVRAENAQDVIDKVSEQYPSAEVVSLSEENIEII